MNQIQTDYRLYEKYQSELDARFKRSHAPEIFTIHGSGGGESYQALMNWMLGGRLDASYRNGRGLYNYIIDRDGEIFQTLPDEIWTHNAHAGGVTHRKMLSVCMVNRSKTHAEEYTVHQYSALLQLIKIKLQQHETLIIATHDSFKPARILSDTSIPKCPGHVFDWQIVENGLIGEQCEIKNINASQYRAWIQEG